MSTLIVLGVWFSGAVFLLIAVRYDWFEIREYLGIKEGDAEMAFIFSLCWPGVIVLFGLTKLANAFSDWLRL